MTAADGIRKKKDTLMIFDYYDALTISEEVSFGLF